MLVAVIVALAITLAVVALASQVGSVWSTRIDSPARPAHVVSTGVADMELGHIPPGCRPKYGCEQAGHAEETP